ncbi:hypothetical protein F4818DRAFT_434655 [Hypoxylon cercidicola]|nr:hypothetical protein F4818DRAFT_434655 [Hypoxylon cercidicola]
MSEIISSSDDQSDLLDADPHSSACSYRAHLARDESRRQAFRQHGRIGRPTRISKTHANRVAQPRKAHVPHSRWGPDRDDSRQLAADPNLVLPGDRARKPSLERQEAFHQPRSQLYHSDVVDDDSELYKLGLLYDDEHTRGSYFNLNTIVHSDPIYMIRPTKRAKKQRQASSYLYLDFSFSSLGSDSDVQQFMVPDVHEIPSPLHDKPATKKGDEDGATRKRSYRDVALSVIHELPENSKFSLESVVSDAADLPDLVSDEEEEEDCLGDWAILEEAEVSSTADADVGADAGAEDAAEVVLVSAAGEETWVVLGDGS